VIVELAGEHSGESFTLPPDTRAFRDAAPGGYELYSTGEVILDPDVLATWTVAPPDDKSAPG
jgi:hypothetical protein